MRAGAELTLDRDLSALRLMASVGEPLNPEAVVWGERTFKQPVRDNWWQTETGGIMLANTPAMTVKPGSMGKPLAGVEAAVLRRRDGELAVLDAPDEVGELALRPPWPAMFRGYLGEESATARPSPGAGISRATASGATPTAISGSSAAATTSSSPPAQIRRRPHRPVRGRERADGASRRGGGGCRASASAVRRRSAPPPVTGMTSILRPRLLARVQPSASSRKRRPAPWGCSRATSKPRGAANGSSRPSSTSTTASAASQPPSRSRASARSARPRP